MCDEDNKSFLSREDFKVAVAMLFDYKSSKMSLTNSLLEKVGRKNLNCIPTPLGFFKIICGLLFEKFLTLMSAKKAAQLYNNETGQIFTAFHTQGFLTFEDFKKAFNSVSPKLSERIIVEAFREVNQDSDGHISFKEFESAMKYGQDEVSPVYFA